MKNITPIPLKDENNTAIIIDEVYFTLHAMKKANIILHDIIENYFTDYSPELPADRELILARFEDASLRTDVLADCFRDAHKQLELILEKSF